MGINDENLPRMMLRIVKFDIRKRSLNNPWADGSLSNRIGEGRFLIQKMDGDFLFQDTIASFEKSKFKEFLMMAIKP